MIMDELGQCAKMADDELIMQITFPHQYYLITLQEKSWMHEVVFLKRWNWIGSAYRTPAGAIKGHGQNETC